MAFLDSLILRTKHVLVRGLSSGVNNLVKVSVNEDNGFATVRLSKPPVNSLDFALLSNLGSALLDLKNRKCQGLLLTSDLPTVFCAGFELSEIYKPELKKFSLFWKALQDLWMTLFLFPAPTVVSVNGHAPAGGCLLSLACDYRIMVNNQKFSIGLNETQVGVVAPPWLMQRMKDVIGTRQAELALTQGRLFSPEDAFKIGLVDELVSTKEEATEKAEKFLTQQSNTPHLAMSLTKGQYRYKDANWLAENMEYDKKLFFDWIDQPFTRTEIEKYLSKLKKK